MLVSAASYLWDLLRLSETPQRACALLAGLASTSLTDPNGFQYWSNRVLGPGRLRFEASQPSAEARSDDLAREIWTFTTQTLVNPDGRRP